MKFVFLITCVTATAGLVHASDWRGAQYLPSKQNIEILNVQKDPILEEVFSKLSKEDLLQTLRNLSGVDPVTINGEQTSIRERYSPAGKAKFRAYMKQYFSTLGISNQEFSYATSHHLGESQGHNIEAVLPGQTADSVVIIVHYDSTGPWGRETSNPGVDDDMTGMAIMFQTAKILSQYRERLHYTVRFVASDYEEQGRLEGARKYAAYIKDLASKSSFQIVAAVDDEQTGWNCLKDGACSGEKSFDVFSCSGDSNRFDYPVMGDQLASIAATYSSLKVNRGCISENSDHYSMWEIGVPAVVFSEHNPFDNPHFDQNGGDTYDRIDQDYYFSIAQIGVTFAASLVGVSH